MINSKEKAMFIAKAISDKKGKKINILDMEGVTLVADYFVIASGNSTTQVQAIANNVSDQLAKEEIPELRKAGVKEGQWILIDCSDIVVHIFLEEQREFYNLERLWGNAKKIEYIAEDDK